MRVTDDARRHVDRYGLANIAPVTLRVLIEGVRDEIEWGEEMRKLFLDARTLTYSEFLNTIDEELSSAKALLRFMEGSA